MAYEKDYGTAPGIEEHEGRGNATISKKMELVPLESFIGQTPDSRGCKENIKVRHRKILSILHILFHVSRCGLQGNNVLNVILEVGIFCIVEL